MPTHFTKQNTGLIEGHWRKDANYDQLSLQSESRTWNFSLFSALQMFMQLVSVNWQTVNTLLCVWHYFLTCYLKLVMSSFQGVKRVTVNVIKIPYTSYPTSFSWVSLPGDWSFINCTSPPGCIITAGLEGGWYSGLAELTLSSSLFSSAAPSSSSAPSVIAVWRTEQQAQNMNSPKRLLSVLILVLRICLCVMRICLRCILFSSPVCLRM